MQQKRATQIAETILQQMGGMRRIKMMIGATRFVAIRPGDRGGEGGVRIDFPQPGSGKPNSVMIHLMPDDTYTVRFAYMRGLNYKILHEFSDIYAEDLESLFTRQTGLHLRFAVTKKANPDISDDQVAMERAYREGIRLANENLQDVFKITLAKWNRILEPVDIQIKTRVSFVEPTVRGVQGRILFEDMRGGRSAEEIGEILGPLGFGWHLSQQAGFWRYLFGE